MDDRQQQTLLNLVNEAKEVADIVDRLRLEVEARNEQVGKQRQQIIALMHEVEALTTQLAARPQQASTGGSPEHLLQDECRDLSKDLASKPAAMLHAREAAQQTAQTVTWRPMATAPRDGTSFLVPPDGGYTRCFWQDSFWWWHNEGDVGGFAVRPEPDGWAPIMSNSAPKFDTSEQQVVATYTKVGNGRFFNATAAGLALPPGKYNLCIAKDE